MRTAVVWLLALAVAACSTSGKVDSHKLGFGAGPGFTQPNPNTLSSPTISGTLKLTADQSSTATGTQTDFALLSGKNRLVWSGASTATFNGFQCGGHTCTAADNGLTFLFINAGSVSALIANGAGSPAADGVATGDGATRTVPPGRMCEFSYEGTGAMWHSEHCGLRGDGATGDVLKFNASTNAWSNSPGTNAIFAQPMQSGRYYFVPNFGNTLTSAGLGNNTFHATPFWIPNTVEISRIGGEVTVAGDAGSKVRFGIYADDGTGRPGALLLDAGQIAGDSATVQEISGLSLTLASGVYWIGGVIQNAPITQPTMRCPNLAGVIVNTDIGTTAPAANQVAGGFQMPGISGALPSTFNTWAVSTVVPRIFIKVH